MAYRNKGYDGPSARELLDAQEKELLSRIMSDIETDGWNWVKSWSGPMPQNPASGSNYSGGNSLLLLLAITERGYEDPRFITFSQAKAEGLQVKKGSHGVRCERWNEVWVRKDDDGKRRALRPQPATDAELEACRKDPTCSCVLMPGHPFTLFNASQIEGFEGRFGPYVRQVVTDDLSPVADQMEEQAPVRVNEVRSDTACYIPALDQVFVPERGQFAQMESFVRTLAHELCHSTGHPSRLDRGISNPFGSPDYAREELVAELGALFTCNAMGLDLSGEDVSDNPDLAGYYAEHVAYLKGWSKGLAKPADELMRAAAQASRASTYLLRDCRFEDIKASVPEVRRRAS